jgi:chemotaxis methyl-accepting protein methylase
LGRSRNRPSPHLFDDKPADAAIRVWIAGCSTGEEAYSIAILFQERIQTLKQNFKVQFFATDIDRRAIDVARTGVYLANIAADVSVERLARFFVQDPSDGTYRVHKNLRDMLVFSGKVSSIRDSLSRRSVALRSGLMLSVVIRDRLLRMAAPVSGAAGHTGSRGVRSARAG